MILAACVLLICKSLYHVDKGFHDFAVGSFARRSISEPFQSPFFRETLEKLCNNSELEDSEWNI
jgi:hypothetical protein